MAASTASGCDLEDAAVGGDRGRVVAELELLDLGGLGQQLDPEVVVGDVLGDLIVEVDQLLPPVEDAGQPVELALGQLAARILAQGPGVGRERGLGGVAADLVQLGDLVEQLDLADRIERVLDHDLVDADLLLPVAGRLVDRLEDAGDRQLLVRGGEQALERADRVVVGGIEIEDLAVGLDRGRDLGEVGLAQPGEADQEVDPLAVVLDQDQLAAEVVAEVAPLLALDVEAVEGAQGRQVVGVVAEDLVVGADRLLGVAQHLLVDRGDLEQDAHPLVGIVGDVGLAPVDLEQLGVLLLAGEDQLERARARWRRRARSRAPSGRTRPPGPSPRAGPGSRARPWSRARGPGSDRGRAGPAPPGTARPAWASRRRGARPAARARPGRRRRPGPRGSSGRRRRTPCRRRPAWSAAARRCA